MKPLRIGVLLGILFLFIMPLFAQQTGIEMPAPLRNIPEQILYRKAYTVSYNADMKVPNWVAWHLTRARVQGQGKRMNRAFHEDNEVPAPRATLADYRSSGYDRGHMCPAGDNKWSRDAMYETFLMTNICPQNKRLNSGDWNEIEMACRKWAVKYGDVYIVCGPIFLRREHETIGINRVVVPEAFFKVVVCLGDTPKGIGFVCRNTDGNRKKDFYVNSIDQVERITGMDFFPSLPDEVENRIEAEVRLEDW